MVVNDASGEILTRVGNAPLVFLDQGVELGACSVFRAFWAHSGQISILIEQAQCVDGEVVGRGGLQIHQHHPNLDWLPVFLLEHDVADVLFVFGKLEFTDAMSVVFEPVGNIRDLVDRSFVVLDLNMTMVWWVVVGGRLPVPMAGITVSTDPVSFGSKGDKGATDCKICE